MNILILQGGDSPEREVSLRSAAQVAEAVRTLGHTVTTYDPKNGFEEMAELIAHTDVVFPMLHGVGGEDGTVQQVLENYHATFVGADAKASQRCFDKIASKQAFAEAGLPTPRWQEVDSMAFSTSELAKKPYVLKPRANGSSVDTFIVRDPANPAIDMDIFQRYETMLLEELIPGIELTVGVLGDETLPVIEIVPPKNGEFDYENKYNGKSKELCPPEHVEQAMQEEAQSLAAEAHQTLGVRHFSRTDIMMSPNGQFYVLEVNTIPGLTEQSLFPKAAAAAGLSMPELMERLLQLAQREEQPGHY